MNTSSTWPSRTLTTAEPRQEARKPTASASASTKPSSRSCIRWRSANASTPASSSCRLTSIPGSPGTTNSDHIRGAGATAKRQCKPSLTPSHSPGRNPWPHDVGQPQPFRHQTGQLSDQVLASTHHVFRAYFKNAFLKQYEKFSTFLRNELVSNNLADFRLRKGLDHLDAVRERFQTITARFAGFQPQCLNVPVDFPLLQRLALPITIGAVRYPGIKIHNPRIIRLLEVLLHGGSHVGGWTAKQIHHAVLATFDLSDSAYGLNQL